jgi:hypothetical protein
MGGEAGEFIHAEQHVQAWLGVAQLEQARQEGKRGPNPDLRPSCLACPLQPRHRVHLLFLFLPLPTQRSTHDLLFLSYEPHS